MRKNTYLRNTALLFSAMAITKIVGAIFKIPLANVLGGTGMGYFSTAYSIYSPIFALTAAGIPTVLMRLTAKNIATGRVGNAIKTKKTALLLFTVVGAVGSLIIWLCSEIFAQSVACSPDSASSIKAIAPAVMLCCIASVYRGYYEGQSDVIPTAVANITEAVSRAVIGLILAYGVIFYARYCYENAVPFLGTVYTKYETVYNAALPYAAAGAITAVSMSEGAGLIALLLHDRKRCKKQCRDSIPTQRKTIIARNIIQEIAPIAAFALIMNCFSFIDLMTVTRTLDSSIALHEDYFAEAYPCVFSNGISPEQLANFMYGSYTGIAMSIFMLIPSFAGMAEKTSIPDIAAAWETKDRHTLCEKTGKFIQTTAVIGFPACLGAISIAEEIFSILYKNRAAELSVCTDSFKILCIGGIFMIFASAFSGFFQAIGKGHIPLLIMIGTVLLKAIINPLLISIPEINITGAAISTSVCYCAASVASVLICKKNIPDLRFFSMIIPPMISGAICAASAWTVNKLLQKCTNVLISTSAAIITAILVYLLLLILIIGFRTSPIIKREKPTFLPKALEKKEKIG